MSLSNPFVAGARLQDLQKFVGREEELRAIASLSIPKVLERGDQYFRELWNSLEDKERKLLLRLVRNQALTPQDNKLVRRLIKKEILQCVENCGNNMCYKYATFQVPLVQKYIEQEIDT
jgi:uncharacterized protein